ncbi:MAG TPA: DUF5615 family PIN-like protein [Mucilaginibacter sp.]|jgi:predicted nuclease of predicted toxin-antitoxin system
MTIWVDAQLSPYIANWISDNFPDIIAKSLRSLKLEDADDYAIFRQARKSKVIIMSKDYDFVKVIENYGPPPPVDMDYMRKYFK